MDTEIASTGKAHTIATLSAAAILFAGVCVLLLSICTQPRGDWPGLWFKLPNTPTEVAARFEREWSPRSVCCPDKSASDGQDRRGSSPMYTIAWFVVIGWILVTAAWFFALGVDGELAVFHSDGFVHASLLIAGSLALFALWIFPFRFGTPCYLWTATILLAAAHVCVVRAEVTLQPWTYPGVAIWMTAGMAFSLLNGWILYSASLTYGMAISSANPIDATRRPQAHETFTPFVPVFFSLYTAIAGIIIPSPALAVWFVIVLLFYAPKMPFLTAAISISCVGIASSALRVASLRGLL